MLGDVDMDAAGAAGAADACARIRQSDAQYQVKRKISDKTCLFAGGYVVGFRL